MISPKLSKASLITVGLLFLSMFSSAMSLAPSAYAQTQSVTAAPGYINLGMTTTITVTAPAAGAYSVVVVKPDGTRSSINLTLSSAGQSQTLAYGDANSGFNSAVALPGTYNVFLEQGSTTVSSTSFYATNKLYVSRFDVTDGGVCAYILSAVRGSKMFPRFFVSYVSNNAPLTNATLRVVTFTLPDKTLSNATWHKPGAEGIGFWIGKVYPNWNSTWTGGYSPNATATDIYGNKLTFTYTGRPFQILPVQLLTTIQLFDTKTGQLVTGLYSGQNLNVTATVTYAGSMVTGTEVLPGFAAPLDPSRGGSVNALVGWGFFNTTSNSFGSSKNPGGLVASLKLVYTGSKGVWSAPLSISSLPSLPAGATYQVIVTATDGVPTPNTGGATLTLGPATVQTTTATTISTSTATTTALSTVLSTATQNVVQSAETIPTWAYALMALLVLAGFGIGFIVKPQKR